MHEVDLVVTNGSVVTMNANRDVFERGYIAVDNGQICEIGSAVDRQVSGCQEIDATDMVVMPGLINCHAHLHQTVSRGLFDEMPLADWLARALWPTLRATTEEFAYSGARLAISELLLGGVTTTAAGEFGQPEPRILDGVLRALQESGMRAVVSRMAIDSPWDDEPSQAVPPDLRDSVELAISELDRLRAAWSSPLIEVVPEALGVLRCTPEMIQALAAYASDNQCLMYLHLASSKAEVKSCHERTGHGCVEYLDQLGALGSNTLLAHMIWPSDSEVELLARRGARVSHNPVANLSYATGIAPMAEMQRAGVKLGLGVDGATTNNSQNLWETMKMSLLLQKNRLEDASFGSAEAALEMATIGGASALGLENEVGTLEVGKRADIICIDKNQVELTPSTRVISNMVSSFSQRVRHVLVDGAHLVAEGLLTPWDVDHVIGAANQASRSIATTTGLADWHKTQSAWNWIPN